MDISWYGLDTQLHTVDHDPVDLVRAYEIVDHYLGEARPHYESGEEALAATTFGFRRPDGSYMQICVHAPDSIDVEHDFSLIHSPLLRLIGGRRQGDEHLTSRDDLRRRTQQFFTLPRAAFRQALRTDPSIRRAGASA